MDVNSINNSISNLNNVPNQQLNRAGTSSEIQNNSDALTLSIKEYNKQRDELSQSLQAFNEGIGISRIAQSGLQKQEEILNTIQDKVSQVLEEQGINTDKNLLKNDINQELLKFREEAYNTQYKRESLLSIDQYEQNETIDISTKEAYYSIDRPNTPEISAEIAQKISKSDLNNLNDITNIQQVLEKGLGQLESFVSQFQNLESNLEASARGSINQQIELSQQNNKNKEINFGKEANDFTKTNVNSISGYLAASQANIVQEQSVRLLS